MHYVHIAGPETYKTAIMIAKMLNDILMGVSLEGHEALNADAPEHSTDDYAGSGDWGALTIWSVKRRKWNMNYRCE